MAKRKDIPVRCSAVIERTRAGMREMMIAKSARAPFPGKWTFPGGAAEAGESPEAALRRILREQLNASVEIIQGQPPFDQRWDNILARWRFYFCDMGGEEQGGESEAINNRYYGEIRWVPRVALREYEFDPVSQQVVDWMLEEQ